MSQSFIAYRRVEFRDTDAAGIMHFSAFVTYMESAEHELLRSFGLSVMHCEVDGLCVSWPRVSVKCDYAKPLRFEDEFEVYVSVAKLGGSSVAYDFEFVKEEEKIANGSITAVCCLVENGSIKPIKIPDTIRQKLLPFVKA